VTTLTSGETTVGAQNLGRESLVSWKGSVGGAFELIKNGGLIVLGARMGVELAGRLPPEGWNFHIGGYQVCQKWLKDRKGRTLTYDELTHYQKVIVALKETIRLMSEIDGIIPGWPVD